MAIKNIRAFNRWVEDVTENLLPEQVTLFQKRVALEVFRRVILKSPVGNPSLWANPNSAPPGYVGGRFRANWQINTILSSSEIDSVDPSGSGTIAKGISNIQSRKIQPFGTIWVFNNVPYAERIEFGWSGQAPGGVVGVTIAEITAGTL